MFHLILEGLLSEDGGEHFIFFCVCAWNFMHVCLFVLFFGSLGDNVYRIWRQHGVQVSQNHAVDVLFFLHPVSVSHHPRWILSSSLMMPAFPLWALANTALYMESNRAATCVSLTYTNTVLVGGKTTLLFEASVCVINWLLVCKRREIADIYSYSIQLKHK